MFQGVVDIAIDKNNRVFTSEIFPGRVQQFRYVTDAEADQLRKEKEAAREKRAGAAPKDPGPAVIPIPQPTPSAQAAAPPNK
jgi:hypothetical protein